MLDESAQEILPATAAPLEERSAKRVLLVDDNAVNLTLGEELLMYWGHEVIAESHGKQALEIFARQTFDFVILDIQMPEIDGVTLMHQMRQLKPDTTSKFIAMTATIVDEVDNQFIEAGFDFYLPKPINRDKFRAILDGSGVGISGNKEFGPTADNRESFDYDGSLMLSASKPELLKKILQMLLRDFPEFRRQLEDFRENHDVSQLGPTVHKIHGVTCYCSLPKLRTLVSGKESRILEMGNKELMSFSEQLSNELLAVESEVNSCLQKMVA